MSQTRRLLGEDSHVRKGFQGSGRKTQRLEAARFSQGFGYASQQKVERGLGQVRQNVYLHHSGATISLGCECLDRSIEIGYFQEEGQ